MAKELVVWFIGNVVQSRLASVLLKFGKSLAWSSDRRHSTRYFPRRISSFRSAATHILPEVIAQFCRRYPVIAVSIAEYDDRPDVEEDLRKGRVDIGITYLPTSNEFETWELMQDELVVLFPPSFEPTSNKLSWEELTSYPLVMAPDGDGCDAMV